MKYVFIATIAVVAYVVGCSNSTKSSFPWTPQPTSSIKDASVDTKPDVKFDAGAMDQ